jgi:hypothetical protein
LARKPSGNDIDGLQLAYAHSSYIFKPFRIGEMLCQNLAAERVYLHLPNRLESGAFKAKVNASDTREQTTERGLHSSPAG